MIWLYLISFLLMIIIVFMIIKIYLMKKSIKEIRTKIKEILKSDTNSLLTISSGDKEIKELANDLNKELKVLRKERIRYENGNQEIKRAITNISHDIRTPLTAIMGYIDLIKEEKEEYKQKEYIEIIDKKTNELKEITDELFDFSKTMDIGNKVKKEICCLNDILEECLASFYNIFKERKINPKVEITKEKIYKKLDKITITRVFGNILSNVSKYSEGDLKVTLEKEGKITFVNKTTSLDKTTVNKIFDRYFTVENARKSTGIGLSIAKELIKINNGKISAKYINNYLIIEIEFD